MSVLIRRKRALAIAVAGPLMLAALALWLAMPGPRADANHTLSLGLDFNPSGTPANGVYNPASLPNFETCAQVLVGQQVSIDLFVLDVEQLVAFESDIQFDGSYLTVTGNDVLLFMNSQTGSAISNTSGPVPDGDGFYEVSAVDTGNVSGDTGYGVLGRITFQGVAPGYATVSLPNLDFNGDGRYDTGSLLRDTNGASLNDTNADGFYDGPYTVRDGTIAVGQDSDGDGVPSNTCPGSTPDNCPNVPGSQSDMDGDGQGDPCDGDADGDRYWSLSPYTTQEADMGSNPLNTSSTPEVCDGVDNDGDGQIDEGYDGNGNGTPDCNDAAVDSDGDGIANPSDTDDDGDGWTDTKELFVRTNSVRKCPTSATDYAWLPDVNNDGKVTISDVLKFSPYFNSNVSQPGTQARYNRRFDWNTDNIISIGDVLLVNPYFNRNC